MTGRVAYDDLSVPVGDLGVVVELCSSDGLFAGLSMALVVNLILKPEGTHAAGDLLELLSGKR